MPNLFFPAPEVAEIGQRLIEQYHEHLVMHDVRVEYVFRSETAKKNEREVWGTCQKVTGAQAMLRREKEIDWQPGKSDEEIAAIEDEDIRQWEEMEARLARDHAREDANVGYFLITISKPVWDRLREEQRVALVDHELMHAGACWGDDGKVQLYTKGHDYEGFNQEIDRYGLWRTDAKRLYETMKKAEQLSLPLDGGRDS